MYIEYQISVSTWKYFKIKSSTNLIVFLVSGFVFRKLFRCNAIETFNCRVHLVDIILELIDIDIDGLLSFP